MNLPSRVYYDVITGSVIAIHGQLEDAKKARDDEQIAYIDVPFDAYDYSKCYISGVDKDTGTVIVTYVSTHEQRRIRELEDAILMQVDTENGGIL